VGADAEDGGEGLGGEDGGGRAVGDDLAVVERDHAAGVARGLILSKASAQARL
jgi:hypothetical protein